jgi:hypothetical protein
MDPGRLKEFIVNIEIIVSSNALSTGAGPVDLISLGLFFTASVRYRPAAHI